MDYIKFVDSFSPSEFDALRSAVWARVDREGEDQANNLSLSCDEVRNLHDAGWYAGQIPAIKALRARTGCGLRCAKLVVDRYK